MNFIGMEVLSILGSSVFYRVLGIPNCTTAICTKKYFTRPKIIFGHYSGVGS
jgi:hypothetical protein